jgi:5-methyltetrahydrofolate--homocysteine methyltransferase
MSVDDIFNSVLERNRSDIAALVQAEIDSGTEIPVILEEGLIAAMDVVGQQFAGGELFVPELLVAADTMKTGLEVLRPLLTDSDVASRGTVVMGTVQGDLHDIGKNLVTMMAEGAGFTVVDLGVDVPPEEFLEAAREHRPRVVGLSALLTTSMPAMQRCVELFRESGMEAKVIVGGAPVNQEYADKIGADGYGSDAAAAVALIKTLMPEAM